MNTAYFNRTLTEGRKAENHCACRKTKEEALSDLSALSTCRLGPERKGADSRASLVTVIHKTMVFNQDALKRKLKKAYP